MAKRINQAFCSPQKPIEKLTAAQDLAISIDCGLSWMGRQKMKRHFARIGFDPFAATNQIWAEKKQAERMVDYQWIGEDKTRALILANLQEVLETRIARNFQSGKNKVEIKINCIFKGKLKIRNPNSLTIVLTGDKGGTKWPMQSTKIGILLADVDNANSPSNLIIAAIYNGDDNKENISARLPPLFDQLKNLRKIDVAGRSLPIEM